MPRGPEVAEVRIWSNDGHAAARTPVPVGERSEGRKEPSGSRLRHTGLTAAVGPLSPGFGRHPGPLPIEHGLLPLPVARLQGAVREGERVLHRDALLEQIDGACLLPQPQLLRGELGIEGDESQGPEHPATNLEGERLGIESDIGALAEKAHQSQSGLGHPGAGGDRVDRPAVGFYQSPKRLVSVAGKQGADSGIERNEPDLQVNVTHP